MKVLQFTAAALLSFAMSSVAVAEPEPGSRIDTAPKSVTSQDITGENAAIRTMNKFGRCVADVQPQRSAEILSLPYLSPEQSAAIRKFLGGEAACLGFGNRYLRFQPRAILSGLAEELILSRYPNPRLAWLAGMTDEAMDGAGLAPRNLAEDFAQCLVRRDPSAAFSLIKSQPTSDAEAIAIKVLVPHLGPCLVEGQKVSLTTHSVRSLAAVGFYRFMACSTERPAMVNEIQPEAAE